MKFYDLDSVIAFGKFKGKTIREIIELQPNYLQWCLINLHHFYLPDHVIEEIKEVKPTFTLSKYAEKKRTEKFEDWKKDQSPLECPMCDKPFYLSPQDKYFIRRANFKDWQERKQQLDDIAFETWELKRKFGEDYETSPWLDIWDDSTYEHERPPEIFCYECDKKLRAEGE